MSRVELGPDAVLLKGFAAAHAPEILATVAQIAAQAPFRHMTTPGGWPMSVQMTNCGTAGWITDACGYRYEARDPVSQLAWPTLPELWIAVAAGAASQAGFPDFLPDACLINRYAAGARMSLHQDKDERDHAHPIVSLSLGVPAVFQWGGRKRSDKPTVIALEHGDVVVWGRTARLNYHGIKALAKNHHPQTDAYRINLTFRRAL